LHEAPWLPLLLPVVAQLLLLTLLLKWFAQLASL
jgi:hypothetical protein